MKNKKILLSFLLAGTVSLVTLGVISARGTEVNNKKIMWKEINVTEGGKHELYPHLSWNTLDRDYDNGIKERFEYRVQVKSDKDDEYETIPCKSTANVLNVYPESCIHYFDVAAAGYTKVLPEGNHLNRWLKELALVKGDLDSKNFLQDGTSKETCHYHINQDPIREDDFVRNNNGKIGEVEENEEIMVAVYNERTDEVFYYKKVGDGDRPYEHINLILMDKRKRPDDTNKEDYMYSINKNGTSIKESNMYIAENAPIRTDKLGREIIWNDTTNEVYYFAKDKEGDYITNDKGVINSKDLSLDQIINLEGDYGNNYKELPKINVTAMGLNEFNAKTNDNFLREEVKPDKENDKNKVNRYKYDVIYLGASNANNYQDLSENSEEIVENFIKEGRGYLGGHDTFCLNNNTLKKNANKLTDYINIKMLYGQDMGDESIKIKKEGLLTRYPWYLGKMDSTLQIPYSHSTGQIAFGHVWLNYKDTSKAFRYGINDKNEPFKINEEVYDGKEGTNNFYLTTWNNTAMIQTGASFGQATPDEEKILANTLFYLSQVTTDTECIDNGRIDEAAPESPEDIDIDVQDKTKITFNASKDNGSTYTYKIQGRQLKGDTFNCGQAQNSNDFEYESEDKSICITSGIKYYLVSIDNKEDTEINNDYIEEKILKAALSDDERFKGIKEKIKNTSNMNFREILTLLDEEDFETLGLKVVKAEENDVEKSVEIENKNENFYVHIIALDNSGNISTTSHKKLEYKKILDIQSKVDKVSVGSDVFENLKILNINKDNKSFKVRNMNNIFSEDVTIAYDKEKLEYIGVCNVNGLMPLVRLDEDEGKIVIKSLCKVKDDDDGEEDILTLWFLSKNSGEARISVENGIIIETREDIQRKNWELIKEQKGEDIIIIE